MAGLLLNRIGSELDWLLGPEEQAENAAHMRRLDASLREKLAAVRDGWGAPYVARVRQKGKHTAAERIAALLDPGSPQHSLNTLVNWGRTFADGRAAPGAGVVTLLGRVQERWVVVIANDNTVAGGTWWPLTPEKIQRAQSVALKLRLPVVYLVDSAGLFLPEQLRSFSHHTAAGHIFTYNARLAAEGVPQIAAVFGDCVGGGAYMPIISDRVIMTESAYMVIAGAAVIKGAKSMHLTSADIGGPDVAVHQSRVADERVPDEAAAIAAVRRELAKLNGSAVEFYRHDAPAVPPRFAPAELSSIFPVDHRQSYPIEEVVARLVDQSLFHEVLPGVGREILTGLARISGLWVGLIANRQGTVFEPGIGPRTGGVVYREGIAKMSTFARTCDDDGIPVVWLQDISGFDIGVDAERLGLLGYGSSLIYANSTQRTPFFTVLLRKASGAGYYAMSGMPFEPVVQLSVPISRLAVMDGRTLAIAAYYPKLDDNFKISASDPDERERVAAGMADTAARIEAEMDPVRTAARLGTDEVVPVEELRGWLECLVEAAWQSTGYRRIKNPRIWALHDLERVAHGVAIGATGSLVAGRERASLTSPTVGVWTPAVGPGAALGAGTVLGEVLTGGERRTILAPADATGRASAICPPGTWVEHGARLLVEAASDAAERSAPFGPTYAVPVGVTVVCADADGTLYLQGAPGASPFVGVGDEVAQAATLALVEVMKTFSPVRAPHAGRIARILGVDGAAVLAGEPLFWLEPVTRPR